MKKGFTLSRRKFLWGLGTAAVSAIVAAPAIEAVTTVFTPPVEGWPSCKCGKPHQHRAFDFERDYVRPAAKQLADDIDRKAFEQIYMLDKNAVKMKLADQNGLSMRFVRNYDINADKFPMKLDVLYGTMVIDPKLAARIVSTEGA